MGKRSGRERPNEMGSAGRTESAGGGGGAAWLPIVLAAVAIVLGAFAWTEAKQSRTELTRRLGEIDQRVLALQNDVAKAAKAPQPQQQGPDPNKVYTVKTEGSPTKGNATAPIVIAEFSDYQ